MVGVDRAAVDAFDGVFGFRAIADQVFDGTVRHVSRRMGRRNLASDNPAQKQDTKVLEALIELAGQPQLPVGLRVDVVIDITSQSSP